VGPRSPALVSALAIAAFASTVNPPRATAQALALNPAPRRAYAPFAALDLDGGVARGSETSRWLLLGAATAGLGLYDGVRVWTVGAGMRGMRGEQRAALATVSRINVETGIGLHAGALWDIGRAAPGVSAGLSLSLFNLRGDLFFDAPCTGYLSLFIRIPAGLLAYITLGGRR
jgi:hypothetical protein